MTNNKHMINGIESDRLTPEEVNFRQVDNCNRCKYGRGLLHCKLVKVKFSNVDGLEWDGLEWAKVAKGKCCDKFELTKK